MIKANVTHLCFFPLSIWFLSEVSGFKCSTALNALHHIFFLYNTFILKASRILDSKTYTRLELKFYGCASGSLKTPSVSFSRTLICASETRSDDGGQRLRQMPVPALTTRRVIVVLSFLKKCESFPINFLCFFTSVEAVSTEIPGHPLSTSIRLRALACVPYAYNRHRIQRPVTPTF